jgi:sugar-specific transcriptional regulator TrmB
MADTLDQVIKAAGRVAELRQRRDDIQEELRDLSSELREAESELESLIRPKTAESTVRGPIQILNPPQPLPERPAGPHPPRTYMQRLLALLDTDPETPPDRLATEIYGDDSKAARSRIYTLIWQARKEGRIRVEGDRREVIQPAEEW